MPCLRAGYFPTNDPEYLEPEYPDYPEYPDPDYPDPDYPNYPDPDLFLLMVYQLKLRLNQEK